MKLLFISWDGPQVSYMEGLFFPIFEKIKEKFPVDFHILQFTWGNDDRIEKINSKANDLEFKYQAKHVHRKPHRVLGVMATILKGRSIIDQYVVQEEIDVLMPRNIFPAIMVNLGSKKNTVPVIFDADGLQLDERVEFGHLKKNSWRYKFLKYHESKIVRESNRVITRSDKSVAIRQSRYDNIDMCNKFFVVTNGRNSEYFKPVKAVRKKVRASLSLDEQTVLFVYCGSMGSKYGVDEMFEIFDKVSSKVRKTKFLILTGSPAYLAGKVPDQLKEEIFIKSVPFQEVPGYLNAADIAFAIIKPTFSMQGVAPVKLGEYLLMGLPTIASKGVGDTEGILEDAPNCHLFDHDNTNAISNAVEWALNVNKDESEKIREFGLKHFSLQESAKSYIKVFDSLEP